MTEEELMDGIWSYDPMAFFPHKKFGYCRKCGKPIWGAVKNGSGCIPANGKCWACASADNDYNIMHFDYCKTDPKEQEEYLESIKKEYLEYIKELNK